MRRALVLACLAMMLSACSEPLEFADWTIPVPEGTRIIEYAAVPLEQRTERIGLVQEMSIDDQGADALFKSATDLAVDESGVLYVLDARARQIKVISPDGVLLDTFGQGGQGPGELMRPVSVALVGDRALVLDQARGKLIAWTTSGERDGEPTVRGANGVRRIRGGAQALMAIFDPRRGNLYGGVSPWSVARVSPSDGSVSLVAELDYTGLPAIGRTSSAGVPAFWPVELKIPYPDASVSRDGDIYVTSGSQYQLLAFGADGAARWALRVASRAPQLTDSMVNAEAERIREHFPDLKASEIPRPDALAAVTSVAVDGHGHVFVFPHVDSAGQPNLNAVPVDVYSAEGERLFAGLIAVEGWLAAHDDDVFRIESDNETGGRRVVRYRLVEPF